MERALYERQRTGAAEVLDDNQKQRLIAMVCSNPPKGRARRTVRLVAEEAVKRILLFSHDLKPWRKKCGWWPDLDEDYIAKMEDVLATYEQPYNQQEPLRGRDAGHAAR